MYKTPHFHYTALISKVKWNAAEQKEISDFSKSLAGKKEAQLEFFEYCRQWKLAPWTYVQLERTGLFPGFDSEVFELFRTAYLKVRSENEKRNATAKIFLQEFVKEGIDVVVLKGNLLAHTVYGDPGYKRMNDFDILIHLEDWDRIQDIYARLGFIPLGFGWSGEKEKPAKFSHTGMSFISPDYSCIVGSQWGLKSPTTSFVVPIDEAWKTALPFDFYGVGVKQLSPEFNLLHLILHMGIFKCGIRDCMDVYNLVLAQEINETQLLDLINKTNAIEKAYFTLYLCNLCSDSIPVSWLQKMESGKSGFLWRRLQKRIKAAEHSGDFQSSYNDYFQDVEKNVIYFNLFPKFHQKLVFYFKILGQIYFPKRKVALKLADQPQTASIGNKLLARLKAPPMVFALIAQEIGWKFTYLLFLKLIVDLVVSIKNYVFKSQSYFDYLKQRGIDPKMIEKVVKNIQ